MVLQGIMWLLQGHDVHVVSTTVASMAASLMIRHQLLMTLEAAVPKASPPGAVYLHRYVFNLCEADLTAAVRDLSAAACNGRLHVLVDEASFERR